MPEGAKKAMSFDRNHPADDRTSNHIELRRRPLRRLVPVPQGNKDDNGIGTRRGRGVPPPCGKEWEYHPTKHFVQGKSFTTSLHLFKHPSWEGREAPAALNVRPTVRVSDRAYASHLATGSASVITPVHEYRRLRRPATAVAPGTVRVLGQAADDSEPAQPMYALLGTRGRHDVMASSRPSTAPSMLLPKTGIRSGYQNGRSAHEDVMKYRYSAGICPIQYKLHAERASAPQLVVPASDQARTNYNDNRASYNINKMRGKLSDVW